MVKPTFSIQWHITTNCDQRCQICYLFNSKDGRKEIAGSKLLNFNTLRAIADDLVVTCSKLGAKSRVSITGGDPILSPFFWHLLEYLQKNGVSTHILGNPFHISDKVAQKLVSLGVKKYQLSLDGMKEIHDALRKQGSFNATTKACEILRSNGIGVAIMSTVSRLNAHEIPDLIKHVVELKAKAFSFARYCPTHNDIENMFTPSEYRNFLSRTWKVFTQYDDCGTEFILKDHLWNLFLMEEGLFTPEPTDGIVVDGCGMGVSHLSVLADGTVFACRRFRSPVGKVPEQSLYDIFLNPQMDRFRDYSQFTKCKNCELLCYCRGCRAVAYGSTGDWRTADPQCWK